MSVQERVRAGRARFIARYRGSDGRERSKTFERRRDAVAWLDERRRLLRRGEWVEPTCVTVGQVAERWHDLTHVPGTIRVRRHLLDNLGDLHDVPVHRLTDADMRAWMTQLLTGRPWAGHRPLAESTAWNLHGQFLGAFEVAREDRLLLAVSIARRRGRSTSVRPRRAVRVIPASAGVLEALSVELAENPVDDPAGPLFRTACGGMWSSTSIANTIPAVRRRAQLPDWVSVHSLRHHHASMLIAAGVSVTPVSEVLGHSNASTTLDVYSHLWPGDDERVRDAVDASLVRDQCGTARDADDPMMRQ